MNFKLKLAALAVAGLLAACAPPSATPPPEQQISAASIDAFYGTWTGTWRRLSGNAGGPAKISIRRGASTFANADFVLNGGDPTFAVAPDFKDGKLVVQNGDAMQMTMTLMKGNRMYISYSRFGNAGEYSLQRTR